MISVWKRTIAPGFGHIKHRIQSDLLGKQVVFLVTHIFQYNVAQFIRNTEGHWGY